MEEGSAVAAPSGGGEMAMFTKSPYSFWGKACPGFQGIIVEVTNVEQAKIAEEAGACCLLVSEPIHEGVLRMPDPLLFTEIKRAVSIPIIVKVRVGHFVEARILEAIGVNYIDESDALSVADDENFINKHNFACSFVCGCRGLGEALRRVKEGAALIRTQGDMVHGSGNIMETLRNVRSMMRDIKFLQNMNEDEVFGYSKKIAAPYDLVIQTKRMGRLPVAHFAAGGITIPADAALMMQLSCDGIFLGSEMFNCSDPRDRIRRMIQAVEKYNDPLALAEASFGLAGHNLNENRNEQSAGTVGLIVQNQN